MNELTKIERNDIFTNSWIIAKNIGRKHKSVTQTIKRFENDLKELGKIFSSTDSQAKLSSSGSVTKTRGESYEGDCLS